MGRGRALGFGFSGKQIKKMKPRVYSFKTRLEASARHRGSGCSELQAQKSKSVCFSGFGRPARTPQWPFNGALLALKKRYLGYLRG